jgi:hypothetical protein
MQTRRIQVEPDAVGVNPNVNLVPKSATATALKSLSTQGRSSQLMVNGETEHYRNSEAAFFKARSLCPIWPLC